jgi:LPXTG-site transpeptidase (sortase) family protein
MDCSRVAVFHTRRSVLGTAIGSLGLAMMRRVPRVSAAGHIPTTLIIPALDIAAPVEVRTTIDGTMQDPTDAWVAAWYDDSATPGSGSNAVFAGHVDDPSGGGLALFTHLHEVSRGERIVVEDGLGDRRTYRVVWQRTYPAAGGTIWVDLTGPTPGDVITLITCAGMWDAEMGTYRERLVVRASLVTLPTPGTVPAHPRV